MTTIPPERVTELGVFLLTLNSEGWSPKRASWGNDMSDLLSVLDDYAASTPGSTARGSISRISRRGEMTNPFGATIELLKGCLEDCGINGFGGDQIESMKASLRVLEAAGKVDKVADTKWFVENHLFNEAGHLSYHHIRELLSALPDKATP